MYFVVDTRLPRSRDELSQIWQRLWELRRVVPVTATLPVVVSSACALLPEEPATTVSAPGLLPVPADSAWVHGDLDLAAFARADGELDLGALEQALHACVSSGEAGHDRATWGSDRLASDSRLNRRLAIRVRGWGDVLRRRGADPGALQTLREVEQLADWINSMLRDASRQLAREHGHCPSLDATSARVLDFGSEMQARWRRAIGASALRHRNLLTLSPWDLFPSGEPADLRYADLLPLLTRANSVCFRRNVDIDHWNINEFRGFHERLAAILRCKNDAQPIAKQV